MNETIQTHLLKIKEILDASPVAGLKSLEVHAFDQAMVRAACTRRISNGEIGTFRRIFRECDLIGLSICSEHRPEFILGKNNLAYKYTIKGNEIHLSTGFGGFVQSNARVNESMVNHVYDLANDSERVLDLYCGNGNVSLPLAMEDREVVGVEKDRSLVELGKNNARMNRMRNVRFMAMDSEKAVRFFSDRNESFDTIILDPPREGAKGAVMNLDRMNPRRIIYISCDPSTLSRDLAILGSYGFKLKRIRLFDMFPQTYHIESVSCLER